MRNWVFFLCVFLSGLPTQAFPVNGDACKKDWEASLGALAEILPSQLIGFRQMRQSDGNTVFISKKCDKIFVGEFIQKDDVVKGAASRELVDRSDLPLSGMVAVGNPSLKNSWVFVTPLADLQFFSQEAAKLAKLGRDGFFLGVLGSDDKFSTCHYERAEQLKKDTMKMDCALSGLDALRVGGGRLSFAISPDGFKYIVDSWSAFLPVIK